MREIKFRGWDSGSQKMLAAQDLTQSSEYWGWLGKKDVILMQYTGLKDKNGKEIYEDDIVNISYMTSGVRGYIRYSKSKAAFILCDKKKEAVTTLGNMTLDKDRFHHPKTCSIIGNIYETPELLGDKNE